MAVGNLTAIVEFSVVSLPSLYFETYNNLCTLAVNGESFEYGIGPNTLIINTLSGKKLYLNNSGLKCMWGFMEFNIILEDKTNVKFSTKRTVQIIIDDQVEDDKMVVSDDLLFNLKDSSRHRLNNYLIFDIIHIVLINNTINNSFVPSKATRVSLSLYQSESHFEEDLLDEALHKYFAYPKYLCKGDVFSIQIDENKLWTFMDVAKVDTIYFKVCEIEDNTKKENSSGLIQGFLVDSSVTVYQVSNHQGFYPPRRVPLPYKLCTQALLNDGVLMPYTHCPVPQWFDEPFKTLVRWFEPFFCRIQDIPLKPVFLLSGPNGSGKSFLLHALSQLFGVFYWRVDCVTISGQIPSQAEAKLKAVFAQLKNQAPCILHLSSIQALYQDLNMKDDVRAICCFEEELKNMNLEWPVIIVGTTCNVKSITSSIHNLFLDSISLGPPNSNHQRKSIISWLLKFNSCFIDDEIMDSVASQTSGFMFRDLQVIVALAFKQKYKRSKDLNVEDDPDKFILEDFSKTIELMHKAYSESIGAPKVPHVSWQDVGGLEPLKKEIIQSLRSNMLNSGLRRSGLLLHGPPGTGKTLLAKAVATECGRNFLSVKGPELLNMYVGQSEQNVRDLFELAKASPPCIVFFDELDSLAPNRGRNGDSGGVMDRVVSQLLSEMDELTYTGDVFMLGATNRPDLIDPALLRPGRLDKLLYVGPCEDRNSQLSVLTALTRKLRLEPDVDLEAVVSRLPTSVSGAQLSALCSAAWMTSARRAIKSGAANKPEPKIVVNQDHFLAAIGDIFRLSM